MNCNRLCKTACRDRVWRCPRAAMFFPEPGLCLTPTAAVARRGIVRSRRPKQFFGWPATGPIWPAVLRNSLSIGSRHPDARIETTCYTSRLNVEHVSVNIPIMENRRPVYRKPNLPHKVCAACARSFAWRRKWMRDWGSVRYCSKRCGRERSRA